MKLILTVPLRALIIKSKLLSGLPMDSETLPISESRFFSHYPTPTLPLTGRINKQPVPKFRHELLNKIYSIFSSVLLDEEPKEIGFQFMGPVTTYSFLEAVGLINDHIEDCPFKYTTT